MKPWGLIAWAMGGILALLLQTTLLFKDACFVQWPASQSFLTALCEWGVCTIHPYEKIDAVVIDHAAIDWSGEAQWVFQLHLRNSAFVKVATPWVELTLTDADDKPVMRKVLDPSAWGAPKLMSPGDIVAHDLLLQLKSNELGFVGYRLLCFYP